MRTASTTSVNPIGAWPRVMRGDLNAAVDKVDDGVEASVGRVAGRIVVAQEAQFPGHRIAGPKGLHQGLWRFDESDGAERRAFTEFRLRERCGVGDFIRRQGIEWMRRS